MQFYQCPTFDQHKLATSTSLIFFETLDSLLIILQKRRVFDILWESNTLFDRHCVAVAVNGMDMTINHFLFFISVMNRFS